MAAAKTAHTVLVVLVVIAIGLMGLLVMPFASAFLLAAVLAGVLHPGMERLVRAVKGHRAIAGALLTFATLMAVVVPIAAFATTLVQQVVQGIAWLRESLTGEGIASVVARLPHFLQERAQRILDSLPQTVDQLPAMASTHGGEAAAAVGGVLSATGGLLFQSVMMLIALYFLLVDGPRLVEWLVGAVPLKRGQLAELLSDFRRVAVSVLVSTLATAGLQAVMGLAGFLIARVPSAVFFTLATFICALIPAIGATAAVLLVAAIKFATGGKLAGLFLAAWGLIVVGLVDNVAKPLFMRGGMEIHGAIIFFSLIGGIAVFGPIGLVAGPLVVAFLIAVVRMYRRDFGDG